MASVFNLLSSWVTKQIVGINRIVLARTQHGYTCLGLCIATTLFSPTTLAFGVLLHYQGNKTDREAYFADVRTISNRTAPDQLMAKTETREIDVTAVYEHPNKPEFVHMKLQFACPNAFAIDRQTHTLTENKQKIKSGDTVSFRMGEGSYKLRRADLQSEPVPASDWKQSNAALLSKAATIACNHLEFDQALHASMHEKEFDFEGFYKRIRTLGLSSEIVLTGQTLAPEFLDFAWNQLWYDTLAEGKRPDPSGKWRNKITDSERQAALKKIEAQQQQLQPELEAARQSLMAGIQKAQTERAARAQTAARPDGKKLTPIESNLLLLWKGRSEPEVINVMGNPEFNQAGDRRFLRYTKAWEKAGLTAFNGRGEVVGGEVGGYAECFVEFITKQDTQGEWHVEDILVRSDFEDAGIGKTRQLCQDLASAASREYQSP